MADNRKQYTVTISGIEHTMLLTADDANRYENAVEVKAAEKPANKSRTASNK